jgi:hypothetical protein
MPKNSDSGGPAVKARSVGWMTVRTFAQRRNVAVATVHYWIKKDLLKGIVKNSNGYLIPESNLTVVIEKSPRNKRRDYISKNSLSTTELERLFESGETLRSIAEKAGVTYQRVQQIYDKRFKDEKGSLRERRKEMTRQRRNSELEESFNRNELLSVVAEGALSHGLEVEGLRSANSQRDPLRTTLDVNGIRCALWNPTVARSQYKRGYYRVTVSRVKLIKYKFAVIVTPGLKGHRIYIIPSGILLKTYNKGRAYKAFYPPFEETPDTSRKGKAPAINWWSYLDRWDLIGNRGSSDK